MTRVALPMVVLVSLALAACAETKPAPSAPAAQPVPSSSAPDAGAVDAEVAPPPMATPSVDAGSAQDAAPPEPPAPGLVDLGLDEQGRVQPCPPATRFTPLAAVFAKRVAGRVQVRGRLWMQASFPCTASFPEYCTAHLVLAPSRPSDKTEEQITLIGSLTRDTTLTCNGPHDQLRCPIPTDGREYGAVGNLTVTNYGFEQWTLEVESLCRVVTGGRQ